MSVALNKPIYNVLHSNLRTISKHAPKNYRTHGNVVCKATNSQVNSLVDLPDNSFVI